MALSATDDSYGYAGALGRGTGRQPTALRNSALALVWLTIAVSGVVFSEPAPVDAFMMMLILALPVLGVVSFRPLIVVVFAVLLVIAALTLLAATQAIDVDEAISHTAITIYLSASFFVIAAFIAKNPVARLPFVMSAYVVAALIASCAGLIGYFELLPGAEGLFTRFGRAAGTFKDPNVFGPFLVPPLLYTLYLGITRPADKAFGPLIICGVLGLALVASFSRGAWINGLIALSAFVFLILATSPTGRQQMKLLSLLGLGILSGLALLAVALRFPDTADLLQVRTQLLQNYDVGPDGRFGGHLKAIGVILGAPLGIGAMDFVGRYHHETPHNVYLQVTLSGGWIAGALFIGLTLATIIVGFAHALKRTACQQPFILLYASFLGLAIQGLLIDTDHWRHYYVVLAMVWALIASDTPTNRHFTTTLAPSKRAIRRLHRLQKRGPRLVRRHLRLQRHLPTRRPARIGARIMPPSQPATPAQRRTPARCPFDEELFNRPGRIVGRTRGRIISGTPAAARTATPPKRAPRLIAYS